MNRRLIKELRPLLLPGLVAAFAAISPLILSAFRSGGADEFLAFLRGLGFFTFVATAALLACLPFGNEIHERTLTILLSQPIGRNRIWTEKLLAVLVVIAALGLLQSWTNRSDLLLRWQVQLSEPLSGQEQLLLGAFLLITICAGGFWTLLARSTIGGVAFTLAGQLLLILGLSFVLERMGYPSAFERKGRDSAIFPILYAGAIYAAALLWAGWRKFAKLELRASAFSEGMLGKTSSAESPWWSSWLRCRPTGYLANLARKELRLQKPVLTIAALVSLCWLATLALCWLTPARKDFLTATANLLTGIFMVLVPLLAGCISLGEEKCLGLNSWQLTLPATAQAQWLVKLAVAAGVALGLGLILPYLLAWLSSPMMDTGLAQALRDTDRQGAFLTSLTVAGLPFLLSFWAASMLTNTVRSALMAIVGLVVLFLCAVLSMWCASQGGGMETALLQFLIAHLQLSGENSQRAISARATTIAGYSCALLGIVFLLSQSLAQFRRARVQSRTVTYYAAAIAGFTFLATFWVVDIQLSHTKAWIQLKTNVVDALQSLPRSPLGAEHSQAVSIQELESTGQLSPAAKAWLRGASITVQRVGVSPASSVLNPSYSQRFGRIDNPRVAFVHFPNGQQELVGPY